MSTTACDVSVSLWARVGRSARLAVLGGVSGLTACATSPSTQSRVPELQALATAPEAAGTLVYRGEVFAPKRDGAVFEYERRVTGQGEALVSTHVSFDTAQMLAVVHVAEHGADYAVRRFDSLHAQTGTSGTMQVDAQGDLHFEVLDNGRRRTRTERASNPVVVGPTLFGYTLAHWDALVAGDALDVQFAVVERARTYGFTLSVCAHDTHTTTVAMRGRGTLTRMAVPTMHLVFDNASRKILRYEGRVPPLLSRGGKLKPLDAQVEYAFAAVEYR